MLSELSEGVNRVLRTLSGDPLPANSPDTICWTLFRYTWWKLLFHITVEFKNDYVLGFIIREIFTEITLQDWVGWGIFTVIPGYPRRASGDSQHLEARSE